MKQNLAAFAVGFLFALGLGISGMTQPQRVIGFLDLQRWDPTLLAVMAGAVAVHAVAYRIIRRRRTPLLDAGFHLPTAKQITPQLVIGAAIFGVGWGIGGFCPGPAVASLLSGAASPLVFVVAMLLGTPSIRDVLAFPKTARGTDPMMEAPSEVEPKQIDELHISIKKPS